jgi:sugar lactone lactonase YvrE
MFRRSAAALGWLCAVLLSTFAGSVPDCAAGVGGAGDATADFVIGQSNFFTNGPNFMDAHSLNFPQGVAIDRSGNVYVIDTFNNRVLGWRSASVANGQPADLVLGQPDFLSSRCNQGFFPPTAATLCTGTEYGGIAVDPAGNLYVADTLNNRVLEFNTPLAACASFPCVGGPANLVFGQGPTGTNFTGIACADGIGNDPVPSASGLCGPTGIAVDESGNLFVADHNNSRVLEYEAPLSPNVTANAVFGQGPSGTSFVTNACIGGPSNPNAANATGLCGPVGVAVGAGNLYIVDNGNNRVLEYSLPSATPTNVFGQDGSYTLNGCNDAVQSSGKGALCGPVGVAFDGATNQLFISETSSNRVFEYSPPNTAAIIVFGQSGSFTSTSCSAGTAPGDVLGVGADSLCQPTGVAVDSSDKLYIADSADSRVLVYNNSLNAFPANLVLGQADFVHNGLNRVKAAGIKPVIRPPLGTTNPAELGGANNVAVDAAGDVYVADNINNRVLGWNSAAAMADGAPASIVIGQPDFLTWGTNEGPGPSLNGPTAYTLNLPSGVAVDGSGNLYVADQGNNRVLKYNTPFAACASGPCAASLVFGQGPSGSNFTTQICADGANNDPSPSASGLCYPNAVAVDGAGNVYVSDAGNSRVLEYSPGAVTATKVFGVDGSGSNFTSQGCQGISAVSLCSPSGVAVDSAGDVYISDFGSNRVLEYSAGSASANLVFGQGAGGSSFDTNTCAVNGGPGASATTLCAPIGIAVDSAGNLWVGDNGESRVLKYNAPLNSSPPNVTADLVLGQGPSGTAFNTSTCYGGNAPESSGNATPPSATGLCGPGGVAVDSSGNLYVVDGNYRVLVYLQPQAATPTPTPSPTATATLIPSPTPSAPTPSATLSSTTTPAPTRATATTSASPSPAATPTQPPTGAATPSQTPSPQPTATPTSILGGVVIAPAPITVSGAPGSTVTAGSFTITATYAEVIKTIAVSASNPSLIATLELTATSGGLSESASVAPVAAVNVFTLPQPLAIPAGGTAQVTLQATLAAAVGQNGGFQFAGLITGPDDIGPGALGGTLMVMGLALLALPATIRRRTRVALALMLLVAAAQVGCSSSGGGNNAPASGTAVTYSGLPASLSTVSVTGLAGSSAQALTRIGAEVQ